MARLNRWVFFRYLPCFLTSKEISQHLSMVTGSCLLPSRVLNPRLPIKCIPCDAGDGTGTGDTGPWKGPWKELPSIWRTLGMYWFSLETSSIWTWQLCSWHSDFSLILNLDVIIQDKSSKKHSNGFQQIWFARNTQRLEENYVFPSLSSSTKSRSSK